jgi:NADH:ubiquinone oxidoreductase subunit K
MVNDYGFQTSGMYLISIVGAESAVGLYILVALID